MKLYCNFCGSENYTIQKEIENHYIEGSIFIKKTANTKAITYKKLVTDGVLIIDFKKLLFKKETKAFIEIKETYVIMLFSLNLRDEFLGFSAFTHNVIFMPKEFKTSCKFESDSAVSLFAIFLSKKFYHKLLHQTFLLPEEYRFLSEENLPIDSAIYNVINEIKNCKHKGLYKRLYIENKIQELLLLQLEMNNQHKRWRKLSWLNKDDLQKLQQAKRLIETDFKKPLNITKLSKKINLNEFKLKKGFKACFGITIKKYIINLRMEYALELLRSDEHNISEIAYLSGYKGLPQFSSAFKTHYGFSPKAIRSGISSKLEI